MIAKFRKENFTTSGRRATHIQEGWIFEGLNFDEEHLVVAMAFRQNSLECLISHGDKYGPDWFSVNDLEFVNPAFGKDWIFKKLTGEFSFFFGPVELSSNRVLVGLIERNLDSLNVFRGFI